MLLQTEQSRSLARSSRIAWASAVASASDDRRTWKASRCADLVPMPGRLRSSSMRRYFHEMIDGVASDLEPRRFETFDQLYCYCYQVASTAGLTTIHILGFDSAEA